MRTHRNADKRGTYRWYNDYRLPERLGGGIVTVRLHSNDEDRQRKFNRAENVRQIPPGARRQLLNLITYAIGVNAMSIHVHCQGLAPPRAS